MTDGPFRNAKLPSRWKRYGDDLVSDAVSREERVARVCHNMLADVDVKLFKPLWDALTEIGQNRQLELDPASSIESLFEAHPNSPHISSLQKHLFANLRNGSPIQEALNAGLSEAITEWREIDKNRFDEHCFSARDRGDMKAADCQKGIGRNRETFDAIELNVMCDALRTGNKNAFKPMLQKKEGLDEAPEE